jgi:hypothetical protein
MKQEINSSFYQEIKAILENARQSAYKAINFTMVVAYWEIGRKIAEEELEGVRAAYGKFILRGFLNLSG